MTQVRLVPLCASTAKAVPDILAPVVEIEYQGVDHPPKRRRIGRQANKPLPGGALIVALDLLRGFLKHSLVDTIGQTSRPIHMGTDRIPNLYIRFRFRNRPIPLSAAMCIHAHDDTTPLIFC
jgi:hypothetical protein